VMITLKGDVKVTDFGMARPRVGPVRSAKKQIDLYGSQAPDHDEEQAVSGTLAYISPEGLFDPANVGTRSDIYSFGLMFYEMLTGKMLFEEENMGYMIEARTKDIDIDGDDMAALQGFPQNIRTIISTCLKEKPARRYQSFAHLSE